ncbi:uncharacterized protein NPIL_621541 [Nephila pilipes]|uniref:Uncharacterized protein n=1 Tax=Nephila pilipes TaxID=299642 RepID=A0A8X6UW22_NEPPI|nr:uncharacterized protein NPIL_621541 [Nephila pilipes]
MCLPGSKSLSFGVRSLPEILLDAGSKIVKRNNIIQRDVPISGRFKPLLPDFTYDSVLEFPPDVSASSHLNDESIKQLLKREKEIIIHLSESLGSQEWKRAPLKDPKTFRERILSNGFSKKETTPLKDSESKSEHRQLFYDPFPFKVHANIPRNCVNKEWNESKSSDKTANQKNEANLSDDSKNKKIPGKDSSSEFENINTLPNNLIVLQENLSRKRINNKEINQNDEEALLEDSERDEDNATTNHIADKAKLLRGRHTNLSKSPRNTEQRLVTMDTKKTKDKSPERETSMLEYSENNKKKNIGNFFKRRFRSQKKSNEKEIKNQNSPGRFEIINSDDQHGCQEKLSETQFKNDDMNQKQENRYGYEEKEAPLDNQLENNMAFQQNAVTDALNISVDAKFISKNKALNPTEEFSRLPKYIDVLSEMFHSLDDMTHILEKPTYKLHTSNLKQLNPDEAEKDSGEVSTSKDNVNFKSFRTISCQTDQMSYFGSFDLNGSMLTQPMIAYINDVIKAVENLIKSLNENTCKTYLDSRQINMGTLGMDDDKLVFESVQSILDLIENNTKFNDKTRYGKVACKIKSSPAQFPVRSDYKLLPASLCNHEGDDDFKSSLSNGRNLEKLFVEKPVSTHPFTEETNVGGKFGINEVHDFTSMEEQNKNLRYADKLSEPTHSDKEDDSAFALLSSPKRKFQADGKRYDNSIMKNKPATKESLKYKTSIEKCPIRRSPEKKDYMQRLKETSRSENSSDESQNTNIKDLNESPVSSREKVSIFSPSPLISEGQNRLFATAVKKKELEENIDWRDIEQTRKESSKKWPEKKCVYEDGPEEKENIDWNSSNESQNTNIKYLIESSVRSQEDHVSVFNSTPLISEGQNRLFTESATVEKKNEPGENIKWRDSEQTSKESSEKGYKKKCVYEHEPIEKETWKNSSMNDNQQETDNKKDSIFLQMKSGKSLDRAPSPAHFDQVSRITDSQKKSQKWDSPKKFRNFESSKDTNQDIINGISDKINATSTPKQMPDKCIHSMEDSLLIPMQKWPVTPDLDRTSEQSAGYIDRSSKLQWSEKHGREKTHGKRSTSRNNLVQGKKNQIYILLNPKRSSLVGNHIRHCNSKETERGIIDHTTVHRATSELKKRIENSRRFYRNMMDRDSTVRGTVFFDDSWRNQSVPVTGRSWLRTYLTTLMIRRYQKASGGDRLQSEDGLEDLATPVLKHRGSDFGLRSYFSQRSLFGSVRVWYFSRKLRAYQKTMNSGKF